MADFRKLAQDIAAAPLGDLISSIGQGVAEAQAALDTGSLEQTLSVYSQGDELQRVLRETGYRPTFYTIPETEGELKLALSLTGRQGQGSATSPEPAAPPGPLPITALRRAMRARTPKIYAAPVDARYQNSYEYSSTVSATVKFRIVAIPPPAAADEARVVPDFKGLTLAAARALAEEFDLVVTAAEEIAETAEIAGQTPAPGTLAAAGDEIALETG